VCGEKFSIVCYFVWGDRCEFIGYSLVGREVWTFSLLCVGDWCGLVGYFVWG